MLCGIGQPVFPECQHVSVRISHHCHDSPRLLGGLSGEPDATGMQVPAEVQQVGNEEGDAGVSPDQRLCLGVYRGVHTQMALAFQELRTERALLGERQTQRIAIELDGAANIVDKNRNAVKRGLHTRLTSFWRRSYWQSRCRERPRPRGSAPIPRLPAGARADWF